MYKKKVLLATSKVHVYIILALHFVYIFETPAKLWFFSVKFFGICIKFAGLFPDRKIRAEQWFRIFRNYFDTLFNEKESIIADFHRFFACLIIEERLSFNIE